MRTPERSEENVMTQQSRLLLIVISALLMQLSAPTPAHAQGWESSVLAAQAVKGNAVQGLIQDIGTTIQDAFQIVRLPIGIFKGLYGMLPGNQRVNYSASRDVNAGFQAPFKVLGDLVAIPTNFIRRL
jgi:hypothetical protein